MQCNSMGIGHVLLWSGDNVCYSRFNTYLLYMRPNVLGLVIHVCKQYEAMLDYSCVNCLLQFSAFSGIFGGLHPARPLPPPPPPGGTMGGGGWGWGWGGG